MTNWNADGSVETPSVEELQARLAKAEAKIVKMKDSLKETDETKDTPSDKDEKTQTGEEKIDKSSVDKMINEALEAYKTSQVDESINKNIETTNASAFTGTPASNSWFQTVSTAEFDKMSSEAKSKYMDMSEEHNWEVVFSMKGEDV